MSDIEYSVTKSDVIKSFDCIRCLSDYMDMLACMLAHSLHAVKPGLAVVKLFILNSKEHEINPAHKY